MHENYRPDASIDVWEAENIFYLKSHPSRIAKLLAHYELYKSIVGLPGAVVELGVFKGASLSRFASFRRYLENDDARRIIGFDAFGRFPTDDIAASQDLEFVQRFDDESGHGISKEDLDDLLARKGFTNIELIQGNVFDTLDSYLDANRQTRICLLHLDLDVYEPTKHCLERLYDRVVEGGLIVIDDYNAVAGATQATDEFLQDKDLKLEKNPFYNVPSFIRK